ncbi:hypothetical protein BU16DRAFT_532503 [Lophium mytilinum]|uniref:Uncharacterized protein n=1 Tax=Lophium mytilinum TaxID=390894 RepID=A0A6A6RBK9_9PEZI|nr:hypothetical protein BU16DRAFT_532503 [Lophium mytilinum]
MADGSWLQDRAANPPGPDNARPVASSRPRVRPSSSVLEALQAAATSCYNSTDGGVTLVAAARMSAPTDVALPASQSSLTTLPAKTFPWTKLPAELKLKVSREILTFPNMILKIIKTDKYGHAICVGTEYSTRDWVHYGPWEGPTVVDQKLIAVMQQPFILALLGSSEKRMTASLDATMKRLQDADVELGLEAFYKGSRFEAPLQRYHATIGTLNPKSFVQLREFHLLQNYNKEKLTTLCKRLSKIRTLRVLKLGYPAVTQRLIDLHKADLDRPSPDVRLASRHTGSQVPALITELVHAAAHLIATPGNRNWKNILELHPNIGCEKWISPGEGFMEAHPWLQWDKEARMMNGDDVRGFRELLKTTVHEAGLTFAGRNLNKMGEMEIMRVLRAGKRIWDEDQEAEGSPKQPGQAGLGVRYAKLFHTPRVWRTNPYTWDSRGMLRQVLQVESPGPRILSKSDGKPSGQMDTYSIITSVVMNVSR